VSRTLALLAAAAALLAGCSESSSRGNPGAAEQPTVPPSTAEPPEPMATLDPPAPKAVVTVIDGDTYTRVAGARVVLAGDEAVTDAQGRAALERPAGTVSVRISAPGYLSRELELAFGERRRHTVRIHREALQWPFFGAMPARTQAHPAIELEPPFRIVWSRGVGSLVEFPAVVWEGVAYVSTLRGFLYAISMSDGEVLWRERVGLKTASSPAIDSGSGTLVVTTIEPGDVQVRDLATGRLEWRYEIGPSEASPVVRDRIVYLTSTSGDVYALDLDRRAPRWTFSTGAKVTSSPALAGDRLFVGDYAGHVYALDAATGRSIWTGSAGGKVYGTVAVAGGRVFVPAVAPGLSAFDAGTGELLWRIPTAAYLYSSPAAYGDRVFFATYSGTVSAASAETGKLLWQADAGGAVSGAVQVVAGVVYAGSFGDRITGWDWRSGRERFRFPHGHYVPLSGNGGRLLLHGFSRIYAVVPCTGACPSA
jgi:outer membrane protein assembly factor BamB